LDARTVNRQEHGNRRGKDGRRKEVRQCGRLAPNEGRDKSDHSAFPAPMPENRSFPSVKEG
jgi:hypothetical protein